MALRDRMKRVYKAHGLRAGGVAETVTLTPHGGEALTRRVSITHRQDWADADGGTDKKEYIEVFILRDETDGVLELSFREKLVRDGDFDEDQTPFYFTGEILEKGQHYIRAAFERIINKKQGAR